LAGLVVVNGSLRVSSLYSFGPDAFLGTGAILRRNERKFT